MATFPAGYLNRNIEAPALVVVTASISGPLFLVISFSAFLGCLDVLPSGLALSSVLLTSGVLYSAGSYALFALVPKHIRPIRHVLLGIGLFLAISGVLAGQLYVKHLAWRVFDPSLSLQVVDVYQPQLPGEPNLVLADVRSYRSGMHCISLDVEEGTYRDLGRGQEFLEVPDNSSGLLHFIRSPYPGICSPGEYGLFGSRAPGGTWSRSFRIPRERRSPRGSVQWLPDGTLLLYSAYSYEDSSSYLCVADSKGSLLRRFEIGDRHGFLANSEGKVVAATPRETDDGGTTADASASDPKPYMYIDVKSGSVDRFGLPGEVVYFADDLSRVICLRTRVENGEQYQSYSLVELPSLKKRQILSEDEFPPQLGASRVEEAVRVKVETDDDDPTSSPRANDAFDTALWVKQRVEGDYFRYSVVLIDLDTAEQRVIVPESATPKIPVVLTRAGSAAAPTVYRFTADQAGFIYTIGLEDYLCEIDTGQSILLANNGVLMDGDGKPERASYDWRPNYTSAYSPSGRRVLRHADIWDDPSDYGFGSRRLRFSAVEVFEGGQPVRLHTGKRSISSAQWLDDRRILFREDEAIHMLDSSGGPPRQIFPPLESAGSKHEAKEP